MKLSYLRSPLPMFLAKGIDRKCKSCWGNRSKAITYQSLALRIGKETALFYLIVCPLAGCKSLFLPLCKVLHYLVE